MVHDFIKTSLMGLVHNWMVDPNFNIEIRLKQLVYIHLKNMFSNSHFIILLIFGVNNIMQFTQLKYSSF